MPIRNEYFVREVQSDLATHLVHQSEDDESSMVTVVCDLGTIEW